MGRGQRGMAEQDTWAEWETARPTQQDIKNMAAKPREGWPAQVLNAKTVWVDMDWWLGAAPLCSDNL